MLAAEADLKLLAAVLVLLGPLAVVLLHDLGGADDALDLVDDKAGDAHLLANQAVVAVVAVVGVPRHCRAPISDHPDVELEELVAEAAAVPGAV